MMRIQFAKGSGYYKLEIGSGFYKLEIWSGFCKLESRPGFYDLKKNPEVEKGPGFKERGAGKNPSDLGDF